MTIADDIIIGAPVTIKDGRRIGYGRKVAFRVYARNCGDFSLMDVPVEHLVPGVTLTSDWYEVDCRTVDDGGAMYRRMRVFSSPVRSIGFPLMHWIEAGKP